MAAPFSLAPCFHGPAAEGSDCELLSSSLLALLIVIQLMVELFENMKKQPPSGERSRLLFL